MPKKLFAAFTLTAFTFVISGCNSIPGLAPGEKSLEEIAAAPFTTEYEYSESLIKSYTENDDFETIAMAGPLYVGKVGYEQPGLKKFQEMKEILVAELLSTVENSHLDSVAYATELKSVKEQYVDYLGQALEVDNKLGKQLKPMATALLESEVAYTTNFALYSSIEPTTTNAAALALLNYQKTYLTLEDISLLTSDTSQTVAGLIALEDALGNSSDDAMKAIAADLSAKMPSQVDALSVKLAALQQGQAKIDHMLKQINSAEYYMGLASVQFVEDKLLALQPSLDALAPKGDFNEEDIQFIKDLTVQYDEFNKEIKAQLNAVDKKELLDIELDTPPAQSAFIPLAFAEEQGYAGKAFELMKSGGKAAYNTTKKVGNFTWEAAKTTLKAARTTAGVTLDTLGAGTKSTFDIIHGIDNGNSASEIANEIKSNFVKIGENFDKGKSGAETWKTAEEYFEAAEQAGGDAAEVSIEKTIGKGWTSWMAGHVGKITVNMFTGLGKGITKVANPDSTAGEIIEGGLDIGLSFIGGSKVIANGSQFAKGSKEFIKSLGKKGLNFLNRVVASSDIKALKGITAEILTNTKLTKDMIKKLISNTAQIEMKEGLQAELVQISKKLNQEFITLIKEGGETVLANSTTGAKQAYKDFVKEAFENSLKGYKEALIGVLGQDFEAYINNVVANKADDLLKTVIKEYVDKGVIRGVNTVPELSELAGSWSNGQFTITDVIMSDEFRAQAAEEGCDVAALEEKIGQSQPLGIALSPSGEGGGTMTLTLDGDGKNIPFSYSEGVIKASFSEEGAVISLSLTVTEGDEAFLAGGLFTITYAEGGIKIIANASATKALPPPVIAPEVLTEE